MNSVEKKTEMQVLPYRELYEEAVRKHVCSRCIDFSEDGICHSQDPEGCAIFRHLPKLVAIAQSLHESSVGPYLEAVRKNVCMTCKNQSANGQCNLRDTVDCGLSRYLPLVLDAIDEVSDQLERSQWRQL